MAEEFLKLFELLESKFISFSKPPAIYAVQKDCECLVCVCVGGGGWWVGDRKQEREGSGGEARRVHVCELG